MKEKRVTAVIVTYNNLLMLSELLRDLQSQTRKADEIIVVDNASSDGTDHLIKRDFPSFRYIRLPENTGSAGGYHEGIKTALENSDLIWTLDDDVRLSPDSLEELLKGIEKLDPKLPVGSVRSVGKRCDEAPPSRLEFFPWRGTLLKTELIRKIGLPLKELFIYGEDLEFAMRFNAHGFYCYWIPSSVCTEVRLEGKDDFCLFGRTVRVYSLPFQLYYAFRNNLYVFLHYRNYHRALRTVLYGIKSTAFIAFLDKDRGMARILAIWTGLLDGLAGRLGKNRAYIPGT
jgi:rhamnopyranosyl-N-acetylglucosaminyl-diphospho-decaprenol beta-1,3/1,4-galactofuranosyltransferase